MVMGLTTWIGVDRSWNHFDGPCSVGGFKLGLSKSGSAVVWIAVCHD